MNITVFGDSILKGILLEDGKYTINREWERRFAADYGATLHNRSRFGCTIRKAMAAIRRDSARRFDEAEKVVLEFGGNDCDFNWAEIAAAPDRFHDCKTPPEEFMRTYREAVALVRASGCEPVILTLPPIHAERYLRFICRDGLDRDSILAWLGDVDAIFRWQEKYSRMAARVAGEEKVRLIDLRGAFLRDDRGLGELLCADGIHPSRSGQGLIFRTLCESVA